MWQSLSYGICNKSSYCMAVCPAGTDVLGEYIGKWKQFKHEIVDPLKNRSETVFVVKGSDAEQHVKKKFPYKKLKQVGNGLRPASIAGFIDALSLIFQREQSDGVNVCYHFTFTGKENLKASVFIQDKKLVTQLGHI